MKLVSKTDALWGGKALKEEEEEEGHWQEGLAGAGPWVGSICLETTSGEALAAGRRCPAPARASPQPAWCSAKSCTAEAPMGPQHRCESGREVF